MAANKLKLNPDKTEFILIGSKYSRKQLHLLFPTDILGNKVAPASNVKNLRVVFDPNLTLTDHISQVIKSTRFHIRDLYRIRHLLDINTAILLANALISSRIDYCNSLFASLTLSELKRLQGVQNSLCRVVTRSSRHTHATPNLEKLHWLPVKYRVLFKIGLIIYKVLKYGQPVYLKDKLHPYTSSRNTRRSSPKYKSLQVPSCTSFLELTSCPCKNQSICHILQEAPENPPFQICFSDLVFFPAFTPTTIGIQTWTRPPL